MPNVINYYRFAKWLHSKGVPILPTIIDYVVRLIFACWIPHKVKAGQNLVLGYGGLGIVIHADAEIGDNVHIDQQVTIGGNGTKFGVPKIGDNVYIGTGAKLLGPINIGNNSIIGANAVVVKDVRSRTVVAGVPAEVIHEEIDLNTFLFHKRKQQAN